MWIYWIALAVSYTVTAIGQVIYKVFSQSKNKLHFSLAISFFIIAPFTSYIALKRINVGMVFIGAALSQVLVMLMSNYFLHENITKDHIISMAFILFGLCLYAIGS